MKYRWIISLIIIICLAFSSCSKSEITVTIVGGPSEKSKQVVVISIQKKSESLDDARNKVEENLTAVEAVLDNMGIDTGNIRIAGTHSEEMDGQFLMSKDIEVIIPADIEEDVVLEKVTAAGVTRMHSPWGLMDPGIQSGELPIGYENILDAAKEKADSIAAAANSTVGKILSIEELNQFNDTVMFRVTYELE